MHLPLASFARRALSHAVKTPLTGLGAALACAAFLAPVQAAPVFNLSSSGELLGASGVMVGGQAYNVEFRDGTCASLFGGCVASAFAFTNRDDALAASQALLTQVFVDAGSLHFDSQPVLINGCESSTTCIALTAWGNSDPMPGGFVNNTLAINSSTESLDEIRHSGSVYRYDTTSVRQDTWAVWTAVPSAVSAPTSLALAGLALAALAAQRSRGAPRAGLPG